MEHILEGKISVKAALQSPFREVKTIFIDENKKDRDTSYIMRLAKQQGVVLQTRTRKQIEDICSGNTHGGIIAFVKERSFQSIEDIPTHNIFIAVVEGVEDPFNFGFVIRSLYAAGAQALLLSKRNWTSAASILAKSSAGASELMPMIVCDDLAQTLLEIKQRGIQIVCANRSEQSKVMYDYDYKQNICLCIGGEKRGLSKAIQAQSDCDVYIPYQNDFKNALSAASATTILAYEVLRQRQK